MLIDQDAIPTFVECKRSCDPRGRREVVAQMLDYAANGILYWPIHKLRQATADTARRRGRDPDEEVRKLIRVEAEGAVEDFWRRVEENLRAGRVRLAFVADEIPRELRRLVEFLNENMPRVEVLAVEVRQHLGAGGTAFETRVIGLTEAARKGSGEQRASTRAEFLARCGAEASGFYSRVWDLAEARGHKVEMRNTAFSIRASNGVGKSYYVGSGFSDGRFVIRTAYMPLSQDESSAFRRELMAFGVSSEYGDTIGTSVTAQSLDALPRIYDILLEKLELLKAS